MDDDDLAALLKSQTSSALPSFYSPNRSPSIDPFANPFASDSDPSSNPFASSGFSDPLPSFGLPAALPSLSERRDTEEINQRIEDVRIASTIGGNGVEDVSPYVRRLEDDAQQASSSSTVGGGGFGDSGGFGSSSVSEDMVREGSNRTIMGREVDSGGFGDSSGFDLDTPYVPPPSITTTTPYNPPPIPTTFESPDAFAQPFGGGGMSGYGDPPPLPMPSQALPTSLYDNRHNDTEGFGASIPYSPPKFSTQSKELPPSPPIVPSFTSPTRLQQQQQQQQQYSSPLGTTSSPPAPVKTRVLPSSILTPDILGSTPEENLKKAFVKSSPAALSLSTSNQEKEKGKETTAESTTATATSSTATAAPASKAYVFKPGGGPRRGKVSKAVGETKKVVEKVVDKVKEEVKDVKETAKHVVESKKEGGEEEKVKAGEKKEVVEKAKEDEKEDSVESTKENEKKEEVNEVNEEPALETNGKHSEEAEPSEEAPASPHPQPQTVPSTVAEQILSSADPTAAAKEVASQSAVTAESSSEEPTFNDLDLEKLPALPDSASATPRAGTPVQQVVSPEKEVPVVVEKAPTPKPPPVPPKTDPPVVSPTKDVSARQALFGSPIISSPARTTTPSFASKFDRVAVSPLDPPQSSTSLTKYERGMSIGGNSSQGFSSQPQSASIVISQPPRSPPTSAPVSVPVSSPISSKPQPSWGRSFDEPDSPAPVPHTQQQQQTQWQTQTPISAGSTSGGWGSDANGSSAKWGGEEDRLQASFNGGAVREESAGWNGSSESYSSPRLAPASPVRGTVERTPSASSMMSPTSKNRILSQPIFTITLSDPTKIGSDPIRGHVVYTVKTRTTSPHYKRAEFSVLRRFSDFLWLFEAISTNNPGVIVPPVPDKHPFGRFEDTFIETRRAALERCLGKISNHPVLGLDPDLRLFLESDSFAIDIKHRKQEMTQEKQGLLASLGGSVIGPKFTETDDWFETKKSFLDSMEAQLKFLIKSIEATSKQRLDLSISISELSTTLTSLAGSDLSQALSIAIERFAELTRKEKEVEEEGAKSDVTGLMSLGDEYLRLIGSVRLAFASRIKSYHSWQSLENETKKLKVNHEKLRKAGKIAHDRIQPALAEIAAAERRASDSHSDFAATTRLIKLEFQRFENERIEDFKVVLEKYLDGMIARRKELLKDWEGFFGDMGKLTGRTQGQGQGQGQVNS